LCLPYGFACQVVFFSTSKNGDYEVFDSCLHIVFVNITHRLFHYFQVLQLLHQVIGSQFGLVTGVGFAQREALLHCVKFTVIRHDWHAPEFGGIGEEWFDWTKDRHFT